MKKSNTKNLYAFVLGREQKIALMELESVLRSFCFDFEIISPDKLVGVISNTSVDKFVTLINIKDAKIIEVSRLIERLGGTIKIFKIKAPRVPNIKTQVLNLISNQHRDGKLKYGISNYSSKALFKNLGFEIKKVLKRRNISSRFVQEKDGGVLSSAESYNGIFNKKGVEIGVFEDYVGILIAVTNPNEWSKRDFKKPRGDRFSGMIPPKLARMMVNIASSDVKSPRILDPFCGSGNILLEAVTLGYKIVGSDISKKAVADTRDNLEWLSKCYRIQINSLDKKVQEADATSTQFPSSDINTVVVTEPYLGTPKKQIMDEAEATSELIEIKKLYLEFLKNIYIQKDKIKLKKICLVFPAYEIENNESRSLFEEIVDEIENMGYTISCSLRYGRDYQVVKREIVLLEPEN